MILNACLSEHISTPAYFQYYQNLSLKYCLDVISKLSNLICDTDFFLSSCLYQTEFTFQMI